MKRRRTVSSDFDDTMDDTTSEHSPSAVASARKRKRVDPLELCQQLYDTLRAIKKPDGTMLCDTFIRAPKRRQEPSYYDVVVNPIDLLRVQQKLKTEAYEDLDELTEDIELLVKNTKAFYKPDTSEHQDACELWETYVAQKAKLIDANGGSEDEPLIKTKRIGRPRKSTAVEDDASETSSNVNAEEDLENFEELFASVMTATDDTSRPLNLMFQLLPSKKEYPDYYSIIEHPIDLKFIATKIQTNAYISLAEMEKDLLQMTKNACIFNEPGSQIYKDAKTLKKIFTTKRHDIESGKCKPKESKTRRRGQCLSAMVAALKEPIVESDDENEDGTDAESEGPLYQLFDALYNEPNSSETTNAPGAPLGESLWKLPNRRFHPEYYFTVTRPISMAQIRNQLKKGEYTTVSELVADLRVMIDNAKKAFPPSHKVHKDAVKMFKVLNQKLAELSEDEEDDSDDDETNSSTQSGKKKRLKSTLSGSPAASNVSGSNASLNLISPKCKFPNNPMLKKKLLNLQKFLSEYTLDGRRPMALFMEKPSKKIYPDYYDVIQHPIDMITIRHNIEADKYGTLDDVVGDFRLMFANCRKYNEENSQIYEDANILERALNEKLKEFSGINDRRLTPKIINKGGRKQASPMDTKLRQLYDAIRDYREPKANRQLALIFMKLPSKSDYPDYYDIIKNPIDMEKIAHKLKTQFYDNVDEIAADFMLMFENACKYNEPDSQIYKDALCLQQICIQTKQQLRDGDDSVPDVPQAVQELLLSLFTTFYNHQDEEGRCYIDSLAELPEYDESDGIKVRAISLDLIKRRLDKGLYKRLDIFQDDVFSCLERARRLSRTDSQIFEDSIELQSYFIRKRDEACKGVLTSPALSYNAMHLSASVESVRQTKLLQEEQENEQENEMTSMHGDSMTIDQKVYSPGDFVYYDIPENKLPGVIYIERLWTNNDNDKMMYGNLFLRPFETYHVTSRKFLEQELFKSDQREAIPLSRLRGKCYVMSIKDYFKQKPEGYADKDIYVCESRYSTKLRAFKKIKNWPFLSDSNALVPRETPLEPKRVMSVFKERVEKHKDELAELQLIEALIEKEKPNIMAMAPENSEEGNNYFEQYNIIGSGVIKLGDYVYVATESGKQSIAQVHTIWNTKDGKSYFKGPWFMSPPEVPGAAHRLFYRQEVLLSTTHDISPTIAIIGRCSVLESNEYASSRPTEIPENDIFVCESTYEESKKLIRRGAGLRKYIHSQLVTPDEVFHFKTKITPVKVSATEIAALAGTTLAESSTKIESDVLGINEDSMDVADVTVANESFANTSIVTDDISIVNTPVTKNKRYKGKLVTGYIVYSSEVRKERAASNPDCSFGDISRMVGNEWRNMTAQEKQFWEGKASRSNEESAARYAEEHGCSSPAAQPQTFQSFLTAEAIPNQAFECGWTDCTYQFEDPMDCVDHCIAEGSGHVNTYYKEPPRSKTGEIDYICQWRGCLRKVKKNTIPFTNLPRLVKHVREVHIIKSGRMIKPQDRSNHYTPSKKNQISMAQPMASTSNMQMSVMNTVLQQSPMQQQQQLQPQQQQQQPQQLQPVQLQQQQPTQTVQVIQAPLPEPLFVTVPPRPQRVLHSEAYIKYIEGLQNETRYLSPWERQLKATPETSTVPDASKLPFHWLGPKSPEKSGDAINALWDLRNHMAKDIVRVINPADY